MNYIDTEVTRVIQSLLGFAPPDARLSYILVQHWLFQIVNVCKKTFGKQSVFL